jgi:hypothetical protein
MPLTVDRQILKSVSKKGQKNGVQGCQNAPHPPEEPTMPPTHGSDSTADHSQDRHRPDPNPPVPLRRNPRRTRRRTLRLTPRHPHPARPSTVWLCAQDDRHQDTAVIANWLLTAIIKIVTTYTQPGHRVLLLGPSTFAEPPAGQPSTPVRTQPKRDPYDGLLQAGWTVLRLGRSVHTQTAGARPDQRWEDTAIPAVESESGLRPDSSGPSPARPPSPDPTAPRHGPDRFDLIITAAVPGTLGELHPTAWADQLTPTGTLAIITHSDQTRAQLVDPSEPLVRAAHQAGLRYHDRIALLTTPVRHGQLAPTAGDAGDRSQGLRDRFSRSVRHTQAHHDLLLLTRQSAATHARASEETPHA